MRPGPTALYKGPFVKRGSAPTLDTADEADSVHILDETERELQGHPWPAFAPQRVLMPPADLDFRVE